MLHSTHVEREELTDVQVAEVCESVGFTGDALEMAIAIALAESGGRTDAVNVTGNTPPSRDRGLFQINDYWHSEVSDDCAFDAQCNAQEAYRISEGGTNWSPWSAYQAGTYVAYLDRAAEAMSMTSLSEAIRNAAWLRDRPIHGIPYNPDAAFPKYAREHSLGAPLTDEWGVKVDGVQYVAQGYVLGIVYAIVGDWANVRSVEW
jgi:hypothetical protein